MREALNFQDRLSSARRTTRFGLYSDTMTGWFEDCKILAENNDPRLGNYLWFANLYSDICKDRQTNSQELQGL